MVVNLSLSRHQKNQVPILVWDLPIRLVHWLIVMLVVLSWFTADKEMFAWHKYSGYAILSLIVFRIYWGFCGSTTAQFANFIQGPMALWTHASTFFSKSGNNTPTIGHNPLGGWNALAMLLLLILQVVSGLFAVDIDGIESGPLSTYISFEIGRSAAKLHNKVFDVLLLLIFLHIIAVFTYLVFKQENLVLPMISGLKRIPRKNIPALSFATPRRALIGIICGILVFAGLLFGI